MDKIFVGHVVVLAFLSVSGSLGANVSPDVPPNYQHSLELGENGWYQYGFEYWKPTNRGWVVSTKPQEVINPRQLTLMQALNEGRARAYIYPDACAGGVCVRLINTGAEPLALKMCDPLWLRVCHESGSTDWMMAVPPGPTEVHLNTGSLGRECNIRMRSLVCIGGWEDRNGIYGTLNRDNSSNRSELGWGRDIFPADGAPPNLLKLCDKLARNEAPQRVCQAALDKLERGVDWESIYRRNYALPSWGFTSIRCQYVIRPRVAILANVERDTTLAIVESLSQKSMPVPEKKPVIPLSALDRTVKKPHGKFINPFEIPPLKPDEDPIENLFSPSKKSSEEFHILRGVKPK